MGIDIIARGLAVRALGSGVTLGYSSLIERLSREGDKTGSPGSANYTTFTANASGPSPVNTPPPGRAVFIQQVSFYSTTLIRARFQFDNGPSGWAGTGTRPIGDRGFFCGPNYPADMDVNAFVRSGDRTGIGSVIQQWLDSAVAGTQVVGCGTVAWTLADSINFDAKKVILMLGDSTWNGTGPSTVDTCVPYLINQFYRQQGVDTRYILKAYSGSTSVGHENYRASGAYEFPQVDAIFYNLGINDAIQAVDLPTRRLKIAALIAWKKLRYPNAKLVVFGTTPVQDTTTENAIAAIRAQDQADIAAMADPNILFCNLGASFNRATDSNYASSDGAGGTRIHPVDAALTQVWSGGYNGFTGLRQWLLTNLPAV